MEDIYDKYQYLIKSKQVGSKHKGYHKVFHWQVLEQKPFVSNNSSQTNKLKCTYDSSVHYTEHRNVGFQIDGQCVRQVWPTTSQVNTVLLPTDCSPVYDSALLPFGQKRLMVKTYPDRQYTYNIFTHSSHVYLLGYLKSLTSFHLKKAIYGNLISLATIKCT
jgi:hypothetical protein